jgi:filamentous hemagglutinin family protein
LSKKTDFFSLSTEAIAPAAPIAPERSSHPEFSPLPSAALSSLLRPRVFASSRPPSPVTIAPEPSQPEFSTSTPPLLAQAIVPANDGVGTVVSPNGNRYDITGGQQSADGANLFHSFNQFGLSQGQIANFLTNPATRNILARIVGGSPSIIDGTIQVSGSHANLYLLNPAGIIFGANASLNVPAAFTATTADGVGFGAGSAQQWFRSVGRPNFATLMGAPTQFAFSLAQPGVILNSASLAVASGQSLNLIGGVVVNTGQLTAPGGQVTLTAVPGTSRMRLSQVGSPLSLELQPISNPGCVRCSQPGGSGLASAPSLPQLLTGGGAQHATGLTINPDGTVQLTGAGVAIPTTSGTTIVTGTVDVSDRVGGTVQILGDRVGLVGATVNASGQAGGGTVLIGGSYQGKGRLPTATQTYLSADTTVYADALQAGNGGNVIVWADDATVFAGTISARGGANFGQGGWVEVSGAKTLQFGGTVDLSAARGSLGTLLLDPTNITIVGGLTAPDDPQIADGQIFQADGGTATFTISEASLEALLGNTNVVLQATDNITIAPLSDTNLSFAAGIGSITFVADADNNGVGSFTMQSATDTIRTNGRTLAISGVDLNLSNIDTSGLNVGGAVTLTARNNVTITGAVNTSATGLATPTGGPFSVTAGSNIQFGTIDSRGTNVAPGAGVGGNVTLATSRGVVQGTGTLPGGNTIDTTGSSVSGTVTIQTGGGATNLPFNVGGGAGSNGTAGAIAAGAAALTTGTFPILPNGGAASGTPTGITIRSVNTPPTLIVASSTLPSVQPNTPVTVTFADLAPTIGDADLDNSSLVIDSFTGTLLKNGVAVQAGVSTFAPGDVLTYTSSATASGATTAFTLRANDQVAFSAPIAITINLLTPPPPPPPPPTPNPPVPSPSQRQPISPLLLNFPPQPPLRGLLAGALPCSSTDIGVYTLDDQFTQEYKQYLGRNDNPNRNLIEACRNLELVTAATGAKPALLYVSFVPSGLQSKQAVTLTASTGLPAVASLIPQDTDQLELVLITAKGKPIRKRVSTARRVDVLSLVKQFRDEITDPVNRDTTSYLPAAQQLYQWLVAPIAPDLQAQEITNLAFIMDAGLRSLPIAALHDGKQFLVEKYSLGIMPSLTLTDTLYLNLKHARVLAMGASEFQEQKPLPAVPVELNAILNQSWVGQSFLNQDFTVKKLTAERQQESFDIIHLATHAEFKAGQPASSYIQFWDTRLTLDQLPGLGWNHPPVKLLVLSSCRTALGDRDAELGFAGLAYQAGVKSVLASLWAVDDEGTLALMTEFYQHLRTAPIKAEALRQAQLALIHRQIQVDAGVLQSPDQRIPLPPELAGLKDKDLSHPYYWAPFTMIGSPW